MTTTHQIHPAPGVTVTTTVDESHDRPGGYRAPTTSLEL
jgi:hypothetical protein